MKIIRIDDCRDPDLWPWCDEKRVWHRESTPGPLTQEARPPSTTPLALHLFYTNVSLKEGWYVVMVATYVWHMISVKNISNDYDVL